MNDMIAVEKFDLVLDDKQKIELVEGQFLDMPQVECPVVHSFGPNVYMRQVTIPAGTIAIGHHQNFEHVNIFVKGKVSMRNEDGSVTTLTAPMTFIGSPGRKIGYIHEEVVWINVYSTNETEIEKLEAHYLTKSETFLEHEKKTIEAMREVSLIAENQGA